MIGELETGTPYTWLDARAMVRLCLQILPSFQKL